MSNEETASANNMEELMALMEGENEHNKGGNTSGRGRVEDKIEEDEDKKDEESKDKEEVEAKYQPELYIGASTRYEDYRLNQHHILEFFYFKSKIVSTKKRATLESSLVNCSTTISWLPWTPWRLLARSCN
jgi:hypothetical protein